MLKKILILFVAMLNTLLAMAEYDNQPDSDNYERAYEAVNNGDHEKVIEIMTLELQNNPENGYPWAWIMSSYANLGEYEEALNASLSALKLIPKTDSYTHGLIHLSIARIYHTLGDKDKAMSEISLAIEADPYMDRYLSMRAELYYEKEKYDLADADYERIINLNPDHNVGYLGIGRNRIAQERYDEAIVILDYALKLNENYSHTYSLRAVCYMAKEEYLAAAQDIVRAIEIGGNEKAISLANTCNDTCYHYLDSLMSDKANSFNYNADWNGILGYVHMCHRDLKKAIQCYKRRMNEMPDATISSYIASCYSVLGNYAAALKYINMSMMMDYTTNAILSRKAWCLYALGEYDMAISAIDTFLELEPEDPESYYVRGMIRDKMHNVDGAMADYTRAIDLNPNHAKAYLGRGKQYRLKGNEIAATEDYKVALELDTIIKERGNCRPFAYLMLGMRDSASVCMQQILDKYPTSDNYYDAACLMSRMGECQHSLEYLKLALEEGFKRIYQVENDEDLDPIRNMEEYKILVTKYKEIIKKRNDENGERKISGNLW